MRICCADGNQFELQAQNGVDVGQFMALIKSHGYVASPNWFVHYDAICWVSKVVYRDASSEAVVMGMTKQ